MKREINCATCAEAWREIARTPEPEAIAAGERVTVVAGTALRPYRCDGCNAQIAPGAGCFATSVTVGEQRAPGWEREFIEVSS